MEKEIKKYWWVILVLIGVGIWYFAQEYPILQDYGIPIPCDCGPNDAYFFTCEQTQIRNYGASNKCACVLDINKLNCPIDPKTGVPLLCMPNPVISCKEMRGYRS